MLLLLTLLTTSRADDNQNITHIEFKVVAVDAKRPGPALKLVTVRPAAKPDLLIPDVRQLFIDKHPKPVK
jgi:hypothetical protein